MPDDDDKVKTVEVSSLLAIDTSMVVWSDLDLVPAGLGSDVRPVDPPGSGGDPGPGPRRVEVRTFHALCNRSDHDPATSGVQPNGIWTGPGHETWAFANGDVQTHITEAPTHSAAVAVFVDLGGTTAGPVHQG